MGPPAQVVLPRSGGVSNATTHPRGVSVQLTQPLFEGFQNLNAIRGAKSTVQAARESLRGVEQTVLLDAVTAYVNVVRDAAIVRLRENDVTVLTEQLKATKDRFDVGEVIRQDIRVSPGPAAAGYVNILIYEVRVGLAAYKRAQT